LSNQGEPWSVGWVRCERERTQRNLIEGQKKEDVRTRQVTIPDEMGGTNHRFHN